MNMCVRMHACVHVYMHVGLLIEFLGAEVTSCKLPDVGSENLMSSERVEKFTF